MWMFLCGTQMSSWRAHLHKVRNSETPLVCLTIWRSQCNCYHTIFTNLRLNGKLAKHATKRRNCIVYDKKWTRCKAKPDRSSSGYPPNCLLLTVNRSVICLPASSAAVALLVKCRCLPNVMWTQFCGYNSIKPKKNCCHSNVPWGIEKLTSDRCLQIWWRSVR